MRAYQWPGNVRELENVVQRALILRSADAITVDDLIFESTGNLINVDQVQVPAYQENVIENKEENVDLARLDANVRNTEESIILQTLQMENGSRKTTAEKLGISPRTLRYKIARMKDSGVVISC